MAATVILCAAMLLSAAWLGWACYGKVTRLETSDTARLEVDSAPYPIQASASGRLVSNYMVLGKRVHAGDLLFELDTHSEKLTSGEEQVRLASLRPQLAALMQQMSEETEGRSDERRVLNFSTEAARAQYKEAEAQAVSAAEVAKRAGQLQTEGIMATADADRARADAISKQAATESLRAALAKLGPELEVRERQRAIRLKQLAGEVAKLETDVATTSAAIQKLSWEIERRRIRAAVSGQLGECAPVKPGAEISEAQQLGVILPEGKLQIVAEFEPSAAFGKIRIGQQAALRLQGFPWAQYGTVAAKVSGVASEIRDGKVRVELAIRPTMAGGIPLQHGLPGSVEVEVERTTPAALLLRSAGQIVGSR